MNAVNEERRKHKPKSELWQNSVDCELCAFAVSERANEINKTKVSAEKKENNNNNNKWAWCERRARSPIFMYINVK